MASPADNEGFGKEQDKFEKFLVAFKSWDEKGPLQISNEEEEEDDADHQIIDDNPHQPPSQFVLPLTGYSIDGSKLQDYPPQQSIREFIGSISDPCEKQLTNSDLEKSLGRLLLNRPFVESKYLNMIEPPREDLKNGIAVKVYGPDEEEHEMEFKIWAGKLYVVHRGWREFAAKYGLRAHTYWLRIWLFRHKTSGQLCFALTWKFVEETTQLIGKGGRGR